MLAAENLTLMRGGKQVVARLSAMLRSEQITVIVGPNGAGKSSLLLGLAGLLEPTDGRVTLDVLRRVPVRKASATCRSRPKSRGMWRWRAL
jgi:ABC-type cobalamin/Fe3+-siderophores transport system ATPase subunit